MSGFNCCIASWLSAMKNISSIEKHAWALTVFNSMTCKEFFYTYQAKFKENKQSLQIILLLVPTNMVTLMTEQQFMSQSSSNST